MDYFPVFNKINSNLYCYIKKKKKKKQIIVYPHQSIS